MANRGSRPAAEAHSGPPLLRRSALLPDESLPSLVLRLARLNHSLPPTLLDHFCLAGVPSHARRASIDAWPPVEVFAPWRA
ncbi:MAG TPA: hypothetical protein VLA19_14005 [Herpetosiphonaceae bacterium]|nr:hypothetical protein [Herpetosiphonaceae bacterium]